MQEIIAPTTCPSCNSLLERRNDIIFCISDTCEAKSKKSVEHWGKTLKIKGLGPQTIAKLDLESICELYWINESYIAERVGSEKLASKLIEEINKSKKATLNRVLPAFGIPLIGTSATNKICQVITSIDNITKTKAEEAGLGPKATESLMNWIENSYLSYIKDNLTFNPISEKLSETPDVILGTVCISGKLKSFKTKALAEEALRSEGYDVKSTLTKAVTILVNESGIESAKTTKARESGVTVIEDLKQLLGE